MVSIMVLLVWSGNIAIPVESPRRKRMLPAGEFTCTAYEASEVSCGEWADGLTATLVPVGLGIAAADPNVLPYGTVVYVETLNRYFIIMDRGGAIKKKRLDLFTESVADAIKLGRFNSTVYIIN